MYKISYSYFLEMDRLKQMEDEIKKMKEELSKKEESSSKRSKLSYDLDS